MTVRPGRSAFTILEMLLVMTVIVMAASLIIAGVDGLRQAYRLPREADQLRALLAGLRARAMDEAAVFEFSFEPDATKYKLRKLGGDAAENTHAAASDVDLDPTARKEFDDPDVLGEHELPAGLSLQKGQGTSSRSTSNDAGNGSRTSLRFLPDGSCTGLTFVLHDAGGGEVNFNVRALTGAVKTSRRGADGKEIAP